MFRKSETEKLMIATLKACKPVEAYLEKRRKVGDAFEALEVKIQKAEEDQKTFLRNAGAIEAKRLLGEATEEEEQDLDAAMTHARDRKDRLEAARDALTLQQRTLNEQLDGHQETFGLALSKLQQAVLQELNEELKQAVRQVGLAIYKLYAFNAACGVGGYRKEIYEMFIPSMTGRENLFEWPVRFHPRTNEITKEQWKDAPEAVKIHERLNIIGQCRRQMDSIERNMPREPE